MSGIALALHAAATGGQPLAGYLERLVAAGITGLEWRLPAGQSADALQSLSTLFPLIRQQQLFVHLRLEGALDQACGQTPWDALRDLSERLADHQGHVVHLVLSSAGGPAPDEAAYRRTTVQAIQAIAEQLGSAVRPILRLGAAQPARRSLVQRVSAWWGYRREEHGRIDPPAGTVRPGLGGPQIAVRKPDPAEIDSPLPVNLPAFSAADTRAALLTTVQATAGAAGLGWDLGHDWLTGVLGAQPGWTTLPDAAFLAAVEHLEVCDALPAGHLHMPLLTGNVPYTTQLRALLGRPAPATTLDLEYGDLALLLGDRFQTLTRSVNVI